MATKKAVAKEKVTTPEPKVEQPKLVVTEPTKEVVEQPKEGVVIPVNTESIAKITPEFEEAIKNYVAPLEPAIFDKEPLKPVALEFASGKVEVMGAELSMEEKIVNFFNSRESGTVKMNDFLKSLYPLPKFNEPAEYLRQGRSKELKGILTKLQAEGKILLTDNNHLKLGSFYYTDGDTQTKYHNILTVTITLKK